MVGIFFYWNFFATSYNKVVEDGACGQLKRELSKFVMSKNIVIQNLNIFFNAPTTYSKQVIVLECGKKQAEALISKIRKEIKDCKLIRNIYNVHRIEIDKSLKY